MGSECMGGLEAERGDGKGQFREWAGRALAGWAKWSCAVAAGIRTPRQRLTGVVRLMCRTIVVICSAVVGL